MKLTEDMKKYQRQWYINHIEEHRQRGHLNYLKNKSKYSIRHKKWAQEHKEKRRDYVRKYRLKNIERERERNKQYREKHQSETTKNRLYLIKLKKIKREEIDFFKWIVNYIRITKKEKDEEIRKERIKERKIQRMKKWELIKTERRKQQDIKNQNRKTNAELRKLRRQTKNFRLFQIKIENDLNKESIIKQKHQYQREHTRKWRKNHPNYQKEYYQKSKDAKAEYWYKHRERLLMKARIRRLNNLETYSERDKRYRKNHPEVVYKSNMKILERMGKPFNMNKMEYGHAMMAWRYTIRKKQTRCAVCGSNHKLNIHHIFPKSQHPALSLNLNNGIALCFIHHREVHKLNPF